jgi:hypothetical protein
VSKVPRFRHASSGGMQKAGRGHPISALSAEETGLRVQIGSLLGVLDRHDKGNRCTDIKESGS